MGARSRHARALCDVIRLFRPLHTVNARILYELRDRKWAYKRNMETLSSNYCCRGKTALHTQSVSVSSLSYPASKTHVSYSVIILLSQQYDTCNGCTKFSTLSHKGTIFGKKFIVPKMCVLIFFYQ
jgi:hypothetical protein